VNPDAPAIAVRALALTCLYQAAGAAFFVALFNRRSPLVLRRVCGLGVLTAVLGIVLVLLQTPLEAARMAGDFTGARNAALLRLALHSSRGDAHALQLVGLALVAVGLWFHRANSLARWTLYIAVTGAMLAAVALTLTGHTSVNPMRAWLAPLLALHLLVAAFWFGALWPLWLMLTYEADGAAEAVLRRFSQVAIWLVPVLALAGIGMAFLLIDSWSTFRRGYGLILIAKATVFALLLILAALNRWRFTPALVAEPAPGAAATAAATATAAAAAARGALRRSIITEYLLIAGVLAMTAVLTSLYSPEH
jgi:putative copper export protein